MGQRPQIPFGAKCWHRQAGVVCEIVKVYFDDMPPYYQVRFADGSERATVRARLDTLEEHAAAVAAAERLEAENRAEAAAAALLAEEEKPTRRPTSAGKGDRGKGKKGR